MLAAQLQLQARGAARIFAHCAALERLHADPRPAPFERLSDVLGDTLARMLVRGLSSGPNRRAAYALRRSSP